MWYIYIYIYIYMYIYIWLFEYTGDELVDGDAETEDVGLGEIEVLVVLVSKDLLGEVPGVALVDVLVVELELVASEAEVAQFENVVILIVALLDQNVLRLHVQMGHLQRVQVIQSQEHILQYLHYFRIVHLLLLAPLL